MSNHVNCENEMLNELAIEFKEEYARCESTNSVTQKLIDLAWDSADKHVETICVFGKPATLMKMRLVTGWTIIEESTCVDPTRYSISLGTDSIKEKVCNELWKLFAFAIVQAKY